MPKVLDWSTQRFQPSYSTQFRPNESRNSSDILADQQTALKAASEMASSTNRHQYYDTLQKEGLTGVHSAIIQTEQLVGAYTQAQTRSQAQLSHVDTVLKAISKNLIRIEQDATHVSIGPKPEATINLSSIAQEALRTLRAHLNVFHDGRALFGSLDQTNKPVNDIATISSLDANGVPTTDYTTDSAHSNSIQLSPSVTVEANIDVTQDVFRNLIGGLQTLAFGGFPTPEATLATGRALLSKAADQLTVLRTDVHLRLEAFEKAAEDVASLRENAATQREKLLDNSIQESMVHLSELKNQYGYTLALSSLIMKLPGLDRYLMG